MNTTTEIRNKPLAHLSILTAVLLCALIGCTSPVIPGEAPAPDTAGQLSEVSLRDVTGPASGTLALYLKDFPLQGAVVKNVWVTIVSVQVHGEAAGWQTAVDYPEGKEFDLLSLVDEPAHLNSTELPVDLYTQVRLILGEANRIVLDGSDEFPLRVPSGQRTGIKIVSEFEVREGYSTSVLLDFDAQESVKRTGRGRYQLRPTVRIEEVSYALQEEPDPSELPEPPEPRGGYERLVFETYPPLDGAAATDTTLELYDGSGLLASDENNPAAPAAHNPSAMIDYTPAAPLASSAVLFVKIYSANENSGSYSIRAVEVAATAVLPDDLPTYAYSELAGINWDDSPYEGYESGLDADPWNDTYAAGEGPARLQLGADSPLHRYLETGTDVDWVMIVLP